uniref:Uncharacterized protein n=1 Tax=viral metagenome TaxID=1070528 RepID=A0A6M3L472_9ZZZZ
MAVNVTQQSAKFTLNKVDVKKILKGAGIAGSAAVLTYLLDILPNIDFGDNTALVVAIISVGINALLKLIAGQKEE